MLLESAIDHEHPCIMKMEVEAPTVGAASSTCWILLTHISCHTSHPVRPHLVQLVEMSLEEMEMPGQHLPAPDAPDVVS